MNLKFIQGNSTNKYSNMFGHHAIIFMLRIKLSYSHAGSRIYTCAIPSTQVRYRYLFENCYYLEKRIFFKAAKSEFLAKIYQIIFPYKQIFLESN